MPDPAEKLTPADPADPADLAAALAFALRFQGRKRVHNADEIMSEMVSNGFIAAKGPSIIGGTALARRFDGCPS